MPTFMSVCSGIGAPEVAWKRLGWSPALMSEIEAFPRAVLEQRHGARCARTSPRLIDAERLARSEAWPPMLWGDFTSLRERHLRRLSRRGRPRISLADMDVIVGGTPCQSFSLAGDRGSLSDQRGNLTLAYVRLADAVDNLRSRVGRRAAWVVWENVPGVLSVSDNAFGCFLGALVGSDAPIDRAGTWPRAGVVHGPRRCAAWRVLDARYFGLAQRRERVFVVARGYFGGAGEWDGPDTLLPVVESGAWHTAPGRAATENTAPPIGAAAGGSGWRGDIETEPFVSATLRSDPRPGSNSLGAIAVHGRMDPVYGEVTSSLDTDGGTVVVAEREVVRRLTPIEWSRLQGIPDDFTAIRYRGKPAKDGPRYKAIGNSMAVPVLEWIGRRIEAVEGRV